VYNIGNSVLKKAAPVAEACVCAPVEEETPIAAPAAGAKAILISRVTCPNCRVAEGLLAKAGIDFEKKIAEENLELCRQYGVKGAPTLIITDGALSQSYYSVPEIKKYLASL
jgi:ribonucleoside-triphosphate reductase